MPVALTPKIARQDAKTAVTLPEEGNGLICLSVNLLSRRCYVQRMTATWTNFGLFGNPFTATVTGNLNLLPIPISKSSTDES